MVAATSFFSSSVVEIVDICVSELSSCIKLLIYEIQYMT